MFQVATPSGTITNQHEIAGLSTRQLEPSQVTNQETINKKEHTMSGTTDEITGRTKEAVGVLTDDKELQREGKTDQAAGATKNKLDDATDWAKHKIDDIKNKLNKNN